MARVFMGEGPVYFSTLLIILICAKQAIIGIFHKNMTHSMTPKTKWQQIYKGKFTTNAQAAAVF